MEHPTGPAGSAESAAGEQAATVHPGAPESAHSERGGEAVPGDSEQQAERPREPVPTTGEPRVDAALRLLDRLPGLPVSEHSEVFEQVHAQLSDVLGELDSGPAGPVGG